jgi:hypothetical protein
MTDPKFEIVFVVEMQEAEVTSILAPQEVTLRDSREGSVLQ